MLNFVKNLLTRLVNGKNNSTDDVIIIGVDKPDPEFKTIYLVTGTVNYPGDWIQADNPFGTNEEADNVVVVEALNWKRFGVPHFILPVSVDRVTDEVYEKVIEACLAVHPELAEVIAKQVEAPTTDYKTDPDYWEKVKASQDSPLLGVFRVIATDDDFYDPNHHYPFDVVVVRNYAKVNDYEPLD